MGYEILYLPLAEDDLIQINLYLSKFYENTVRRVFMQIEKQIISLKDTPKLCEVYAENSYYRRMVIGDYLVFYHVNDEQKNAEIHRILRGSYDISRYLQQQVKKNLF